MRMCVHCTLYCCTTHAHFPNLAGQSQVQCPSWPRLWYNAAAAGRNKDVLIFTTNVDLGWVPFYQIASEEIQCFK